MFQKVESFLCIWASQGIKNNIYSFWADLLHCLNIVFCSVVNGVIYPISCNGLMLGWWSSTKQSNSFNSLTKLSSCYTLKKIVSRKQISKTSQQIDVEIMVSPQTCDKLKHTVCKIGVLWFYPIFEPFIQNLLYGKLQKYLATQNGFLQLHRKLIVIS